MKRRLYGPDHEDFRTTVRAFIERELVPQFAEWDAEGKFPKSLYRRAGELGIIAYSVPEEHGGAGVDDYRYSCVLAEEAARAHVTLGGLTTHMNVVLPYLLKLADETQKKRWLPGVAAGELMTSIAMSEPGTGSDLSGISSSARREGEDYVLRGTKTFITGGINADLVVVVARTSSTDDRRKGLSLLVVEDGMQGFSRGRKLDKLGGRSIDTAELVFDDVRVPAENLLGEEGRAFEYLTMNLVQERIAIAVMAVAQAQAALDVTVRYVGERAVFGQPLSQFQNTKFVLAECATEVEAAQVFLDRAVEELLAQELSVADAAKVKLFCTEAQGRVVDACLQLFGGYGYMLEYPISRMYADARVTRIYGGSSEIMKVVVAKSLGL